jgi:hypothetical protein
MGQQIEQYKLRWIDLMKSKPPNFYFQPLQKNQWQYLKLGRETFVSYPFQFIIL